MIAMRDICFAYRKKERLFDNLSLTLEGGNIYGLLGKNGVGKSTLLKIICGLLFPRSGECRVLGFDPSRRHPDMLREIFIIAEELFVPSLTIREYIALYAPFYLRFDTTAFRGYMEMFALPEKEKLTRLSYGQKKKFLLAFGLATGCRILVLDEPTNGLDIPGKSQFRKLMASSITEDRVFVVSTHQVRDMQHLIDPVIILDKGTIIFKRSVAEINERLGVGFSYEEPAYGENGLYCEKVIGGYSVLSAAGEDGESDIDLEMLFNAVVKNSDGVNAVFTGEKHGN